MARWMKGGIAAIAVLVLGGVLFMDGTTRLARLALGVGANDFAASIATDPAWKGFAYERAGDYAAAAREYAQAGPDYALARANALARAREYAQALALYDRIVYYNRPGANAAKANAAIVRAVFSGTGLEMPDILPDTTPIDGAKAKAEVGLGLARAAGTGDLANNTGTAIAAAELISSGTRKTSQIFDAQFIIASKRWLNTMEDQPARYLKARIKAIREQRMQEGQTLPEGMEPW